MEESDHYKVLQVDPEASVEVIRAAYRVLAGVNHPDRGGSPDAMARLNLAWNALSDATRRAAYDRERRIRQGGDRWDAYAVRQSATEHSRGTILDFGRYAGWSIPEIAVVDPDFLEWFARTPSGRRHRSEIDAAIARSVAPAPAARASQPRARPSRFGL